MELEGRITYFQCCQCGKVFHVNESYDIEELYIEVQCPCCMHDKALNCGDNREDLYWFYDANLDSRYFY